ncbi:MAG: 50S ribosomal protein L24 [Lachnospiraceae bacterium]|nr:50S ribosomal protein L24 [Lachnospiraceae bacterium]
MNKIKKGDIVKIITGKDKGSEGKVLRVEDGKVLVEGCNMVTKHQKASQENPKGGIVKVEALVDASNVMLVFKGKPTRVGFKKDGDKKVRVAKSTGDVID